MASVPCVCWVESVPEGVGEGVLSKSEPPAKTAMQATAAMQILRVRD